MADILVVIPCGRMKIWTEQPRQGPTPARDAYISAWFKTNRRYAERFGTRWVILSDKYGFVDPEFVIPGPYDVSFSKPATNPISLDALRTQVAGRGLDRFATVIALGGRAHRDAVRYAFEETGALVAFPFAGLGIDEQTQRTREATWAGEPFGNSRQTSANHVRPA